MKASKKIIFLKIFFYIFFVDTGFCFAQAALPFKVGLAVLKDNADYSQARTAFKEFLEGQEDISVEFYLLDAQGDAIFYEQGLRDFVENKKIDLLFTTGTRSTLPAVEWSKQTPVVFTAVAAPVEAGIVSDFISREENITGTHCAVSSDVQATIILRVLPFARTFGIVYTKNEPNAEIQIKNFKSAASALGVDIVTSSVLMNCKSEEEIAQATKLIISDVDVLIALQDTSLSLYGKGMIDVANEFNIPVYTSLTHLLSNGALLSLGSNFYNIGFMAGEKAKLILKDQILAKNIPIETDLKYLLAVNLKSADKLKISIPVQILRIATYILD